MSVSYHLAHAADRRAAAALGHWGAARGLALKPSQSPDEGSCLLLDRTDAIHGAAVRGTAIGARNGWVAHVGLPVRRYRALYAVPMLGPLADQRIDDWTLVQAVLTPGEVAPLRRLVLSRRDLLDLPALALLPDGRVDVAMVSVDLRRDTPEVMRGYLGHFFTRYHALVAGDEDALLAAEKPFGAGHELVGDASTASYTVDHTAGVYVVDPQGMVRGVLAYGATPEAIAADLGGLLDA